MVRLDAGFIACACLKRLCWFSSQVWKHHDETVQLPLVILIKLSHYSLPSSSKLDFICLGSFCHCYLVGILFVCLSVCDKVSVALVA